MTWLATTTGTFAGAGERPPGCAEIGEALGTATSYAEASEQIERAIAAMAHCSDPDGATAFALAARLRDNGDPRASTYYERAIAAAPDDPDYEIAYADYLRVYRGPQQPLFPEAEEHYYRALSRIRARSDVRRDYLLAQVQRRLAALYERDGVPIASWSLIPGLQDPDQNRPLAFVSTQNRLARALDGFDEVDGIRDLSLAEKFAAGDRLHRSLTDEERRDLVHGRYQFETVDRLRLRYRWLPVLDVFYTKLHADDAQVTQFGDLDTFNDVDVWQAGVALERTFDLYPYFDLALRTEYAHGVQEGLIEFAPSADEEFDAVHLSVAASRFWGPDKISLQLEYFYQDIDQHDVAQPIDRSLEIVGVTARYQQFTPVTFSRLFDLRTNELFAGYAHRREAFGDVDVRGDDVFVGVALRGLRWLNFGGLREEPGRLDLQVQPTLFLGDRDGTESGRSVSSLSNAQYRTSLAALYRVVDNENDATLGEMEGAGPVHLAFLNLVVPVAQELAVDGPNGFDDVQVGLDLVGKIIVAGAANSTTFCGTTVLAQLGYRFQRFYEIDESQNLFNVSVNVGF